MKNKIKFYKFGEIKEVTMFYNKKKNNNYKKVVVNSAILSLLLIVISASFCVYENQKITDLVASVYNNDSKSYEKPNGASKKLKEVKYSSDNKYEVLINPANPIDEKLISNYKQVDVKDNLIPRIKLEKETYKNYLKLKQALTSKGYFLNIEKGFISSDDSNNIISEHNIGISFDAIVSNNITNNEKNYKTDEYKYLEKIAYLYGFIVRYPKGKEKITGYNYNPWHFRYVGKDLAKYLVKNKLTLEEYYNIEE